ncbi:T9SS type B sorting domain-containing protein [Flavobacterium rakeshii]|uniref:T9SS type B sorting domain-containing protein n=1 Tax=Flavobacterium rakeshii TaxID=1038845 RepID=A0A6N8HDY1_9FLAO|nr:T9SS type B sorting domain-containing protein [Flavobacterium rakeshii]MUV04075.1 T9SS type B sorting domain-containing protein [Flavobacterium rakeshii]
MKKITLLLLLLLSLKAFAQKEANYWYFGNKAGLHFLDNGTVQTLSDGQMTTNEGCSSISDELGNLLFYTDGRTVWDQNHVIMPNANYSTGTGLLGDPSSTQSGIIVPKADDPNIYYIFTVDEPHHENTATYPNPFPGPYIDGSTIPASDDGLNNGFNYSIVDLSVTGNNGSIGDVTTRNVHLVTYDDTNIEELKYKCSEKITAVKNAEGTGYWVITHFINKFYAFFVDSNGVNETPVISELEPLIPTSGYRRNAIGCIKISPTGNKLVVAHTQAGTETGETTLSGKVYLYDMDNATGEISNPVLIKDNITPYGVEFSPSGKKLYVSYDPAGGLNGVYQYDVESSDIPLSQVLITSTPQSGTLQLGPNGKIYRAVVASQNLDVINNPEETGIACGYQTNAITLPAGAECFFGLPPFITSYFFASIEVQNTCLGEESQFTLLVSNEFDAISWNFGDGSPASNETIPTHTYTSPGTYNVVANITYAGEDFTFSQTVTIVAIPVANDAPNLTLCDISDDGTENFVLSNNTDIILGDQDPDDYDVTYYDSLENAHNANLPVNPNSYNNSSDPQTIYARVQNKSNTNCYDITSFMVSTIAIPAINATDDVRICANSNSHITLSSGITSSQYTYEWSTGETTPVIQVSRPGTYAVTLTNQNGCKKTQVITVTPSDVAQIESVDVVDLVDNNTVTVHVTPTGGVNTTYGYSIDMPNGPFQESNFFERVKPGVHTVYVSDVNGCGTVLKQFSVLSIPKFFTPNGDGVHDTWDIVGMNLKFYQNSTIFIYDRYGKLLASVDPKGKGWDGTFNGHPLPSTDYWYVVALDDGRVIKGHFSMIR